MAVTAKVLEYAVEVDPAGRLTIPGGSRFVVPEGWSADHLLLAALLRCSLESFGYHARRAGHTVEGNGAAHGTVTKTEDDGRYRFVALSVEVDVRLTPPSEDHAQLIAKAERDCFVAASLSLTPEYTWHVS